MLGCCDWLLFLYVDARYIATSIRLLSTYFHYTARRVVVIHDLILAWLLVYVVKKLIYAIITYLYPYILPIEVVAAHRCRCRLCRGLAAPDANGVSAPPETTLRPSPSSLPTAEVVALAAVKPPHHGRYGAAAAGSDHHGATGAVSARLGGRHCIHWITVALVPDTTCQPSPAFGEERRWREERTREQERKSTCMREEEGGEGKIDLNFRMVGRRSVGKFASRPLRRPTYKNKTIFANKPLKSCLLGTLKYFCIKVFFKFAKKGCLQNIDFKVAMQRHVLTSWMMDFRDGFWHADITDDASSSDSSSTSEPRLFAYNYVYVYVYA